MERGKESLHKAVARHRGSKSSTFETDARIPARGVVFTPNEIARFVDAGLYVSSRLRATHYLEISELRKGLP